MVLCIKHIYSYIVVSKCQKQQWTSMINHYTYDDTTCTFQRNSVIPCCSIEQPVFYLHKCIASVHWCRNDKSSMYAIYSGILFWSPWPLASLVCCQDHQIATLSTSVIYVNTCSAWIKAMGTIADAPIMCSKCMPTIITVPLCTKFLIHIAPPWCVCPNPHLPILAIKVLLILW